MVARLPRGDLGQGAGWGLVPRLEDAPEDPVRAGWVPYCPWWGGPWGEHGVCAFDKPLRARGRGCSGYHVVVPTLEACTPDLQRGVVTVCRWGRDVVVWGAEAGGVEGGVAGWCGGLFALPQMVQVRWVVPPPWGSSQVYGPLTCDVDVGVVCQGLAPLDGGDPDVWPWLCLRARQSTRSTMASWRPLPWVVRSRRALTVSRVLSSCRRYQPRGVVRALPWRVAWRRSGSRMVAGVRGGVPRVRGGWAGWVAGVLCVYVNVWLALVGLGRAGRCRVASWVTHGLWGSVVVSWRPADGDGGGVRCAQWVSGRLGHARHGNG